MKIKVTEQSSSSHLEIEAISFEEIEMINGGNAILGETFIYWVMYAIGSGVKSTKDHMSQLPAASSGYAQTYKMGSF